MNYEQLSQSQLDQWVLRLALASSDIGAAGAAVEAVLNNPYSRDLLSDERQAMGEAAVAAYYRPFDKNRRGVNLGPAWPGYSRAEWNDQHARLLELRHGFVGHSDREDRYVIVKATDDAEGWSIRYGIPAFFLIPGEAERTLEMCRDLSERIHEELGQACRAVIARERTLGSGDSVEIRIPRTTTGSGLFQSDTRPNPLDPPDSLQV